MLLSLARWAENTEFFAYVRSSSYMYPVILSLHMVAIALFGGMIVMTDLRLLGWAMHGRTVADVVVQLRLPKRIGFVLAARVRHSIAWLESRRVLLQRFLSDQDIAVCDGGLACSGLSQQRIQPGC
jgi:hypothetical protein